MRLGTQSTLKSLFSIVDLFLEATMDMNFNENRNCFNHSVYLIPITLYQLKSSCWNRKKGKEL